MDNQEFLTYIYKVAEMGANSSKQLLSILNKKDNKITSLVEEEYNEYKKYQEEICVLLKSNGVPEPTSGLLVKASSYVGINLELMRDNSDSKIADMLIQGFTMGVLEITRKLKKFHDKINKEERTIAENLIDFQNKQIKILKKYL